MIQLTFVSCATGSMDVQLSSSEPLSPLPAISPRDLPAQDEATERLSRKDTSVSAQVLSVTSSSAVQHQNTNLATNNERDGSTDVLQTNGDDGGRHGADNGMQTTMVFRFETDSGVRLVDGLTSMNVDNGGMDGEVVVTLPPPYTQY